QCILAFELVDVVGKKPRHPVGCSLGPTGLHVMDSVAKDALERGGKFADQFLEELGDVGSKPPGCSVAAGPQEQQQVSVRRHAGLGEDAHRAVDRAA
ncbi:hypothetical protein OY671_010411, partial [Metschnikowia pulcherrima]